MHAPRSRRGRRSARVARRRLEAVSPSRSFGRSSRARPSPPDPARLLRAAAAAAPAGGSERRAGSSEQAARGRAGCDPRAPRRRTAPSTGAPRARRRRIPLGGAPRPRSCSDLALLSRARRGQTPARQTHPARETVDRAERDEPPFDAALAEEHRRGRRARRDGAECGAGPRIEVFVDVALSRNAEPGGAHRARRRRERVDRIGERPLLRDQRSEQHRGQQEAGGRDAGGDESASSAVGPHPVQAEGEGAGNTMHPRRSLDS